MGVDDRDEASRLSPAELRPYFSITVLECVVDDAGEAFTSLTGYLRQAAQDKGRALAVELISDLELIGSDNTPDDEFSHALRPGFDRLFAIVRRRATRPAWASDNCALVDSVNQLSLAVGKGRLVAIRSEIVSSISLLRWADRPVSPYRAILPEILQGTFDGDGKMVWLQGVHRKRASLASSKALGGQRLQEVYDALEDSSYALTAMRIKYVPEEENAALRGQLTVSPDRSHLSAKSMQDLPMFISATNEALAMLEKQLAAERPPPPTLPGYAVRERNLAHVLEAYDIRVLSPDEVIDEADYDDLYLRRAQLLRDTLRDVRGDAQSANLTVGIGRDGVCSTRLALTLQSTRGGAFELRASPLQGTVPGELVSEVLDAIRNTDLLSIYYGSGHAYMNRQIARIRLTAEPYRRVEFRDFDGFDVKREKPLGRPGQQLHSRIGRSGDHSLFGWVQQNYHSGFLICDDGPGEIADFLHLADDGTLSVIHVKAAYSNSTSRSIAVTSFEQLVSQAEKGIRRLASECLHADLLAKPPVPRPACWTDGQRVANRSDFLTRLSQRSPSDKTFVVLVQPHLTNSAWSQARATTGADSRTTNAFRLTLLDNLLHSTRRTITSVCDDLLVVGCA